MKFRSIFLLSGFVLAMGASFAFTSNSHSQLVAGYYYYNAECLEGTITQSQAFCSPTNTGPACTILGENAEQDPAYENQQSLFVCVRPLYQPN